MGISSEQYIILTWIFVFICLVLVGARLTVRTLLRQWAYWLSDALLGLSFLCFVALASVDTYKFAVNGAIFGRTRNESFAKLQYGVTVLFYTQLYLPRLSLLAFYYELLPLSESKLRKCLHFVTGYTVATFVAVIFLNLFWCGKNISQNWSKSTSSCSVAEQPAFMYINWSIGMISEVLVFLLPFPLFLRLKKLTKRDRFGLTCIFMLGAIAIAVSTVRIIFTIRSVLTLDNLLVAMGEIATQIMVVALPALRPLLGMLSLSRQKHKPTQGRGSMSLGEGSHTTRERQLDNVSSNTARFCTLRELLEQSRNTVSAAPVSRVDSQHSRSDDPWEKVDLPHYLADK